MRNWTTEEMSELARMYQDPNYLISEVVELMDRSENAIRLKASRLGLSRPVLELSQGNRNNIIYDKEKNTLLITRPVDTEEVLDFICEVLRNV